MKLADLVEFMYSDSEEEQKARLIQITDKGSHSQYAKIFVQGVTVLVITAVYDSCCNGLLLDWTLQEADHKWNIKKILPSRSLVKIKTALLRDIKLT